MEPYEIEDTSDWLGSPTELETCKHYLAMVENEVQELTLQLRKAREDIFGLVQMHSAAADERDQLRAKLRMVERELLDARREASHNESRDSTLLTAKERLISELWAKIVELTGVDPHTRLPGT